MTTLLVGFDSAWTATNSGAIVAAIRSSNGTYFAVTPPLIANYAAAQAHIIEWQEKFSPTTTIVMLDQPTIVNNSVGQRPVENLVASPVSLRYGGVQPANTGRSDMFGVDAPMWPFLEHFGGPCDPQNIAGNTRVFETYPVLAMIALNWLVADSRATGRLPKYNPQRSKTFSLADWKFVCGKLAKAFNERKIAGLESWFDNASKLPRPTKYKQDRVDSCVCLLVGTIVAEREDFLVVGDLESGYIVVPYSATLCAELEQRCGATNRDPRKFVRMARA